MKFKFETGEVIDVFDDAIAKLLRVDSRYEEVKAKPKGNKSTKKDDIPEGDELNDQIQE